MAVHNRGPLLGVHCTLRRFTGTEGPGFPAGEIRARPDRAGRVCWVWPRVDEHGRALAIKVEIGKGIAGLGSLDLPDGPPVLALVVDGLAVDDAGREERPAASTGGRPCCHRAVHRGIHVSAVLVEGRQRAEDVVWAPKQSIQRQNISSSE